jgi:hypothetical protein
MAGRIINTAETLDKLSRTDCLLSVLRSFKYDCTTAFGPTIRSNIDIGANDVARRPEQILQILPSGLIGQLKRNLNLSQMMEQKECSHFRRKAGSRDFDRRSYGTRDEVVAQQ